MIASEFILLLHLVGTLAADADAWQSRTIYQIVTDRFATASSTPPDCNPGDQKYCGGTWNGITQHLDYIQGMGFDAIWISPVVQNIEGHSQTDGSAYHGYWAQDISQLNTHFGTSDDLKNLSRELHGRGMYLMVDVVANHLASLGAFNTSSLSSNMYGPFNQIVHVHPQCWIQDYNNQTDVEQCWLGDDAVPLIDLNTENDDVVSSLHAWVGRLVSDYQVDGLRIDTVKHVRKDFWRGFQDAAGVYCMGEVLSNDIQYVAPYTDELDAVLDYPAWFLLGETLGSITGNLSRLVESTRRSQSQYKKGLFSTASFISNHDQPRFGNISGDLSLVMNALTWTFVTDSIPTFYYGDEQGYTGGNVPWNREPLWDKKYSTSSELYGFVRKLNAARTAARKYSSSFHTTASRIEMLEDSIIAISKPPMVSFLTNQGSKSNITKYNTPSDWKVFSPMDELVDVLNDCEVIVTDTDGVANASVEGGRPMILLPKAALAGSGICAELEPTMVKTGGSMVVDTFGEFRLLMVMAIMVLIMSAGGWMV